MDVLSFSKVSKTLKDIEKLNKEIIGEGAASHFKTVDHRLDWIEGQASKARLENHLQVDLSQGTFENTELVNGKIQLKKYDKTNMYSPQGTWTSPILDLGEGYHQTKLMDFVKQVDIGGYTENIIPKMTNSTKPKGEAKASSYTYPWYPWKAFDGLVLDNGWLSENSKITNQWLSYRFTQPKKINKYTISSYKGGVGRSAMPKKWRFEGSNDEVNWVVLDVRDNVSWFSGINEVKEFEFKNDNQFYLYRIFVEENNGNTGYIRISELEMMEALPGIEVQIELSISQDGIHFSEYTLFDPDNIPQGRYVKIRATLTAQGQEGETVTYEYDQSEENKVTENEQVIVDGNISLKKNYSYTGEEVSTDESGKIMKTSIPASLFKKIHLIEVKK